MLALSFFLPSASADFRVKLSDGFGNSRGGGHGGEFLVEQVAGHEFNFVPVSLGETQNRFEVFCLERLEFIAFGQTYRAEISDAALDGGVGGGPNGDPLDDKTAYLYSQFVTGNLAGYGYGNLSVSGGNDGVFDRTESANALQNVIWYLEQEVTDPLFGDLNLDEETLATAFLADTNANYNLQAFAGQVEQVKVMNLYGMDGVNKQDQLIMVPAPGAVTLGILGLGMISAFRRRSRTSN